MKNIRQSDKRVYLIAGEPSGDQLGALLMAALRRAHPSIQFFGIGGEKMEQQGMASHFPMHDLSLMGLVEVLPHLCTLTRRLHQTVDHIAALRPDVLVTIDSPGFTHRVIEKLVRKNIRVPVVHYVAPTVWAWKPKRAEKLARLVDHLMVLLPFEPPYFECHGLPTTFVGHPVVHLGLARGRAGVFRKKYLRHQQKASSPVVCLLPGSRRGEVARHLPVLKQVAEKILRRHPAAHFVIPTLEQLRSTIEYGTASWDIPVSIVTDATDKIDLYAATDLAIAASGTVSVELAAANVPHIIFYRMNRLTHALLKRMIRIRFASLINILENRMVVPEFIQKKATAEGISRAALDVLAHPVRAAQQRARYKKVLRDLTVAEPYASKKAADVISRFLVQKKS